MRFALQYDMTGVIPALKDAVICRTYQLGATEKRSEFRPGLCCNVSSIPLKSPWSSVAKKAWT